METFRFRITRPADVQSNPAHALSITASKISASAPPPSREGLAAASNFHDANPSADWLVPVADRLAQCGDLVDRATLISWLPDDWRKQAISAAWTQIGTTLANALADAFGAARNNAKNASAGTSAIRIIHQDDVTEVETLSRPLLLHDLTTTLAMEYGKPDGKCSIVTAEDVQAAMALRAVALPAESFAGSTPVLARQPGVTDLYIVKDEWNRYIAGEAAAVTNVLPGETLEHRTGELIETEVTQETADTKTTTTTEEHSQSSSQSLSTTASSDASLSIGVQGQIETSGQYGPTHVQTSLGAQLQGSQSNSNSRAITTAVETVDRAVKTVSETVSVTKSTRRLQRTTTGDKRTLENTGHDVTVGVYRWLSSVHRMQLERYPNRFVLEFEIPEPGAWLRWALEAPRQAPWDNPDPGEFTLKASEINLGNWQDLASTWGAEGLTPPPPAELTLSVSLKPDTQDANATIVDETLTVPNGYEASTWTANAVAFRNVANVDDSHETAVYVSVGDGGAKAGGSPGDWIINTFGSPLAGDVGKVNAGAIPIAITTHYAGSVTVVINVTYRQINADDAGQGDPYRQWQQECFDASYSAYTGRLTAFHQERASREQQDDPYALVVGPPEVNLSRSVAELKRLVIADLMGNKFSGFELVDRNSAADEPSIDPSGTELDGEVVQFFEQAFEWENLVYICYPYFWGNHEDWSTNVRWASADPVFDQFLNAGSARVIVPARPGLENLVNYFLRTGEIWGGRKPPAPNEPGYLSIADEIQAIQKGATDGVVVGPSWEIVLPTTLLWAGTDESALPYNSQPTIGPPEQ